MDLTAEIEAFLAVERLPDRFRATIAQTWSPLADAVMERFAAGKRPFRVGLCGPQGSGKSTGAAVIRLLLQARGLKVALLSLDDVYLTHAQRQRLAAEVHPLLATRGPPGTHDLALLNTVLAALAGAGDIALPAFDKARDDRRAEGDWPLFKGPADVILLEGWCVGAEAEPAEALIQPINGLERDLDAEGVWRRFVNTALEAYQPLFASLDFRILLQAPSFDVVADWRREQEAKLQSRLSGGGGDLKIMSADEITRFVQHYERITRRLMKDAPERADGLVELDAARHMRRLRIKPAA